MPTHLIDIEALRYVTQGRCLIDGVSLTSDARRIGIVGRNGSGKTTLARLMAGLIPPASGNVRIAGVDVARDRKAALRCVGILFQNPDQQILFPTVEEELAFGLKQLGLSKRDAAAGVADVLARFGKSHWARAAVHELSQGQRQLVCLMAVLAMAPQVIILDEPFSGLDISTAAHLTRVLDGLAVTLVQITHDPAALAGYDRVIWLEAGRIMQEGVAAPVLAAYRARMAALGAVDDLSDLAG